MKHLIPESFNPPEGCTVGPENIAYERISDHYEYPVLLENQAFTGMNLDYPHRVLVENLRLISSDINKLITSAYSNLTIKGPSLENIREYTAPADFGEYHAVHRERVLMPSRDYINVQINPDSGDQVVVITKRVPESVTLRIASAGTYDTEFSWFTGPLEEGYSVSIEDGRSFVEAELLSGSWNLRINTEKIDLETVVEVQGDYDGVTLKIQPQREYRVSLLESGPEVSVSSNGSFCSLEKAENSISQNNSFYDLNLQKYVKFSVYPDKYVQSLDPSEEIVLSSGSWISNNGNIISDSDKYNYIITGNSDVNITSKGEKVTLPANGIYAIIPNETGIPSSIVGLIPRSFIESLSSYGEIEVEEDSYCEPVTIPAVPSSVGYRFTEYEVILPEDSHMKDGEILYFSGISSTEDTFYLADRNRLYSSFADKDHDHDSRYYLREEIVPRSYALGGKTADDFAVLSHGHTEFLRRDQPAIDTRYLQQSTSESFARVGHEHPGDFYTNGLTPEELHVFLQNKDYSSHSVPGGFKNLYKLVDPALEYWEGTKNPLVYYYSDTGYKEDSIVTIVVEPVKTYIESLAIAESILSWKNDLYKNNYHVYIISNRKKEELATMDTASLTQLLLYTGTTDTSLYSGFISIEQMINYIHAIPGGKTQALFIINSSIDPSPISGTTIPEAYDHYWILPTGTSWEDIEFYPLQVFLSSLGDTKRHELIQFSDADDILVGMMKNIVTTQFGQKSSADPEETYYLVKNGVRVQLISDPTGKFTNLPETATPEGWVLEVSDGSYPVKKREDINEPSWDCTSRGCRYLDSDYGEYLDLKECQVGCNVERLGGMTYPAPGWGDIVDTTDALLNGPHGDAFLCGEDEDPISYQEIKNQFNYDYYTVSSIAVVDHKHDSLFYSRGETVQRSWGLVSKYYTDSDSGTTWDQSLPAEERDIYKDGIITAREIAKRYHVHPWYTQYETGDLAFYKTDDTVRTSQMMQNRNWYLMLIDIHRSSLDYYAATTPVSVQGFTASIRQGSDKFIERFSTVFNAGIKDLSGFTWNYYQDGCSLEENGNSDPYYPEDIPVNWSVSMSNRLEGTKNPGYCGLTAVSPLPTFASDGVTLNSRSIMALGWSNKYPEGVDSLSALDRKESHSSSSEDEVLVLSQKYTESTLSRSDGVTVELEEGFPSVLVITSDRTNSNINIEINCCIESKGIKKDYSFSGKLTVGNTYRVNLPEEALPGSWSSISGTVTTSGEIKTTEEFVFDNIPVSKKIDPGFSWRIIDSTILETRVRNIPSYGTITVEIEDI